MRSVLRPFASLVGLALASSLSAYAPRALAQQAPAPAPAEPPVIRAYALIKPTLVFSTDAVESFGQPNAVAATAAGNPVLAGLNDEAFVTFQAVQSRLGFWFDEKGPIRGHFEFDFVDFAKSSPTTAALPRLRIAAVEWKLSDQVLLAAGQDWDLSSPINPYMLNIVSVAFQAGNTGFMRHQAKLMYTSDSLEVGAALGMAGINNTARLAVPEYNQLPSLAVRAALLMGTAGRVGVSVFGSRWRFAPEADNERKALAGSATLYGDVTPVTGLNLRFEAYFGRNLANTGALSLGNGSAAEDIDEVGGFLSLKYALSDANAIYATAGMAQVLNDEDVLPSYAYAGMPDAAPDRATAAAAGTGPGILWNRTARLGYEYRHSKSIAVLLEGFAFQTKHQLNTQFDTARFDDEATAFGGELGFMFTL